MAMDVARGVWRVMRDAWRVMRDAWRVARGVWRVARDACHATPNCPFSVFSVRPQGASVISVQPFRLPCDRCLPCTL